MKNYQFGNLKRITKAAALKAYAAGQVVTLAACNINPANVHGVAVSYVALSRDMEFLTLPPEFIAIKNCFNDNVASFEYYNCNSETGRYTAFYITC